MFCPKCGNQLEDGASFCPSCGNQLNVQQAQPQQQVSGSSRSSGGFDFKSIKEDLNPKELFNSCVANLNPDRIKKFNKFQWIALGAAFFYWISMFFSYNSALGLISVNYYSNASVFGILLTYVFILYVDFTAFADKAGAMIVSGGLLFLFTIFMCLATMEDYCSHQVGYYFMLISSLVTAGAGVWKMFDSKKN